MIIRRFIHLVLANSLALKIAWKTNIGSMLHPSNKGEKINLSHWLLNKKTQKLFIML